MQNWPYMKNLEQGSLRFHLDKLQKKKDKLSLCFFEVRNRLLSFTLPQEYTTATQFLLGIS
jgi:hypothetical protein